MLERMNQRQFARYIGVSQPRVAAYIRDGNLKKSLKKKGRFYEIDPELGLKELGATVDPDKRKFKVTKKKKVESASISEMAKTAEIAGTSGFNYQTARALKEQYRAGLTKIEYELASGKTVLRADVERVGFAVGQQVKETIMSAPERMAPELAAMDSIFEIKQYLIREFTQMLDGLSEALRVE